jgi:xylan 1,4-beta-xylosidase
MIAVDSIIADSVRGEPDIGAIASTNGSRLTVLLWNYHDIAGGDEDRRALRLEISGLPRAGRNARAVEYSIDETSGNAYSAWVAMGSPQPPSPSQIAQLHAAARLQAVPRKITRTTAGNMQLELLLPRQSVKLVEIDLKRRDPG